MTGTDLPRPHLRLHAVDAQASVTTIELFFDLVFVFALTQSTELIVDDLTARGVIRGVMVLALLWWSWAGYAWIGNTVRADEGTVRLVMFTAMAAMFVLALAIPEAFRDRTGGLTGPIVVAVCYFVFRLLHIVLYFVIARDDPGLHRQLVKFAPAMLAGTTLLLLAAEFHGTAQTLLWAVALLVDYGGTIAGGAEGWRSELTPALRRAPWTDHHCRPRRIHRGHRRRRRRAPGVVADRERVRRRSRPGRRAVVDVLRHQCPAG